MSRKSLTTPTSKDIRPLLDRMMHQIHKAQSQRPDLILAGWSVLAKGRGKRFASMTEAFSFQDGILNVKVKNSSILSCLQQYERPRLLKELRDKFPSSSIRNIHFYMG